MKINVKMFNEFIAASYDDQSVSRSDGVNNICNILASVTKTDYNIDKCFPFKMCTFLRSFCLRWDFALSVIQWVPTH